MHHRQPLPSQRILAHELPVGVQVLGAAQPAFAQLLERSLHRVERVPAAREDAVLDGLVHRLRKRLGAQPLEAEVLSVRSDLADGHAVLGERPGLVHTEHRCGAQHLHGGDASNEDPSTREAPRSESEKHRHDDGKLVRQNGHRQRQSSEDAGERIVAGDAVGDGGDRRGGGRRPSESRDQAPGLGLKRRFRRAAALHRVTDAADLRAGSRRLHAGNAAAGGHQRPRVEKREVLASGARDPERAVPDRLADRGRLARDQRLVGREVAALKDHHVRGHPVPLGQHDQIVNDQLPPRDATAPALSDDERAGAGQVAQGLQGVLRLPFLHERQRHDEDDEAEKHKRLLAVAEDEVDPPTHEKQQRHRLAHQGHDTRNEAPSLGRRQLVIAVANMALRHLLRAQPGERTVRGGRTARSLGHDDGPLVQELALVRPPRIAGATTQMLPSGAKAFAGVEPENPRGRSLESAARGVRGLACMAGSLPGDPQRVWRSFAHRWCPWAAVALALVLVAGFVELSEEVLDASEASAHMPRADVAVLRFAARLRRPWLNGVAMDLTALGSPLLVALFTIALGALLLIGADRRGAAVLGVASFSSALVTYATKAVLERPRPDIIPRLVEVTGPSYPSGHSLASAAVYLTAAFVVARHVGSVPERVGTVAFAATVVMLMVRRVCISGSITRAMSSAESCLERPERC